MSIETEDSAPLAKIAQAASATGIDLKAAAVRRTSSRLCLGVEHGDYNGTRLFGAGIDRFLSAGGSLRGRGRPLPDPSSRFGAKLFHGAVPRDFE